MSLLVFDRADNEALQRTLESALASVYGTIEIVVIPKDSESLAGRIPRHVIKHVRACRLRAQATGFERLATAWREARGQYAVILGAGDCLDPYFVEHHLFVQRGYAPCTISSCTSQWIEADANTTVRSITGSEAAGAVSPLCDWPFGPLAANMVARTRHVDLLFDAMQPDKATGFAHASGWLLLQYARAIGTLSRFDECLLRYSASDGSAVPWALPGDARDGSEKPDHAMTASVILSIVCANLDTFEKVFARAWQGQLASWLARGQTSASLGALAAIARSSGALIATQVLEKALYAHSLDLRNSE